MCVCIYMFNSKSHFARNFLANRRTEDHLPKLIQTRINSILDQ